MKDAFDMVSLFNTRFQKAPRFIRQYTVKKLTQIPFVQFFQEVDPQLLVGNRDGAANVIYQRTDAFLTDGVDANNTRWVLWLLPLNIVPQTILALKII